MRVLSKIYKLVVAFLFLTGCGVNSKNNSPTLISTPQPTYSKEELKERNRKDYIKDAQKHQAEIIKLQELARKLEEKRKEKNRERIQKLEAETSNVLIEQVVKPSTSEGRLFSSYRKYELPTKGSETTGVIIEVYGGEVHVHGDGTRIMSSLVISRLEITNYTGKLVSILIDLPESSEVIREDRELFEVNSISLNKDIIKHQNKNITGVWGSDGNFYPTSAKVVIRSINPGYKKSISVGANEEKCQLSVCIKTIYTPLSIGFPEKLNAAIVNTNTNVNMKVILNNQEFILKPKDNISIDFPNLKSLSGEVELMDNSLR